MPTPTSKPTGLRAQLWARARVECAAEIAAVAAAVKDQQSLYKELSDKCLLAGQAKDMIETMERVNGLESPTPERLLFHAQTLANLKAISENPSVQQNAARSLNAKFLAAENLFATLEAAAEKSFDAQIPELVSKEREFFAGFGLPHEPTAVSRMALEEKARIRTHCYDRQKQMLLNSPGGGVLAILDVSALTALFEGALQEQGD